jgi:hypothetical protein
LAHTEIVGNMLKVGIHHVRICRDRLRRSGINWQKLSTKIKGGPINTCLWKPKISDTRGQEEARISNRFTTILDPVSAKNQIIGQRGDNTEIHLKTKDGIHARYRKDSGSHSMLSTNSRAQNPV